MGVQTLPMLSFQTPESDTFLCLLPREMVAVYRGRFVPLCPGTEWGNERQTMRGEEMEGRVHDKEPFHRCNWYLSFFRKRFLTYRGPESESGHSMLCSLALKLSQGFIMPFLCSFHFEEGVSLPSLIFYVLSYDVNYWLCRWLRSKVNIWWKKKKMKRKILICGKDVVFPTVKYLSGISVRSLFYLSTSIHPPTSVCFPYSLSCLVQVITQNSQRSLQNAGRS